MSKPFSQACENNKQPIAECLIEQFASASKVLEIGSGTGQHSVHFAPLLPHLNWHTSDVLDNHAGIVSWHQAFPADNLHAPLCFKIGENDWPLPAVDAVFSANTAHIMQWHEVELMFQLITQNLADNGVFCLYGPFNVNGEYTSDSNAQFDLWLAEQGFGGIRDIEALCALQPQLTLQHQYRLPANNQLLVFRKQSTISE
ncbi:DUF938 domain-containing protein [Neptunicella marina]|uniref:DUF938 domain-containing protein n=1 Tax=Neptunicella marina TaxID=2125989 RepID=A0A8J6ITE3_9ALTE|nr:DUF938 domain-containing protein [Neptunicella marina]MBC3765088.1 DUF938 domain-containing protein [Neptunicella marina]